MSDDSGRAALLDLKIQFFVLDATAEALADKAPPHFRPVLGEDGSPVLDGGKPLRLFELAEPPAELASELARAREERARVLDAITSHAFWAGVARPDRARVDQKISTQARAAVAERLRRADAG